MDLINNSSIRSLVDPAQVGAGTAVTSNVVDCAGFRWAVVVAASGAFAASAPTALTIQEGDLETGAGATDIEDVNTRTPATLELAAAKSKAIGLIDLHRRKRYLSVAGSTGAGGATSLDVKIVLFACMNTQEYLDQAPGGADEISFKILS